MDESNIDVKFADGTLTINHAFAAHVGDPRQKERAHRIAWAAVKRSYVKVGGSWIGRSGAIEFS
jgi:ChaB protein